MQDFSGGGANIKFWGSCEPLLGGLGHALKEKFNKWCNFVRFEGYFQPFS